jgi:hypothetical protein
MARSADRFIYARTAPPVDVVGALAFADGIALYPRPDEVPGMRLVLYGAQFPGSKAAAEEIDPSKKPCAMRFQQTQESSSMRESFQHGFGANWQMTKAGT